MAALLSRCGHCIFALLFVFFYFFFPLLILAVADWMSSILRHMRIKNACLKCAARGLLQMRDAKNRHLHTITQLCRDISSQLRYVSTIGKKELVKQQYLLHMSLQYGKLRPTSGWDLLASLGLPNKFQRVSRLGSVTAGHSSSGHHPHCGIEQRSPPIFGRAAITLGIGPHF